MSLESLQLEPRLALGDFNGDGFVDWSDYVEFRNAFNGVGPIFDFNQDGKIDQQDYEAFRNVYGTNVERPPLGVAFDSGCVTIRTNAYGNTCSVNPNAFNPSELVISISGTDQSGKLVLQSSKIVSAADVKGIYFYGQEAHNMTVNMSKATVPCVMFGGTGSNSLQGGSGNDVLFAGPAGSTSNLIGNDGDDRLIGGAGVTYFHGGKGHNILQGGSGVNYFVSVQPSDTVTPGTGENYYL